MEIRDSIILNNCSYFNYIVEDFFGQIMSLRKSQGHDIRFYPLEKILRTQFTLATHYPVIAFNSMPAFAFLKVNNESLMSGFVDFKGLKRYHSNRYLIDI